MEASDLQRPTASEQLRPVTALRDGKHGHQPPPDPEMNTALVGSPTATLLEDLTQKPPS